MCIVIVTWQLLMKQMQYQLRPLHETPINVPNTSNVVELRQLQIVKYQVS